METVNSVSRITVMKCLGPPLVPFFKMFALFYVLYPEAESSTYYCLFKCAPLVCLMAFVYAYGKNSADRRTYTMKILFGLFFSCLGDICLVWNHYLILGMALFGVAHIWYISAFGFRPLKLPIMIVLFSLNGFFYIYMKTNLSEMFSFALLFYATILTIMMWRALAKIAINNQMIPWTSIACAIGAILFCISDVILSFSLFSKTIYPISYFILPTYYLAQLCFAVSVVDSQLNSLKVASLNYRPRTS